MKRTATLWLCAATACASSASLRLDNEVISKRLISSWGAGAYRCAPKELALAEAHTEFVAVELSRGDAQRAAFHRDQARQNLTAVLHKSKGCAEPTAHAPTVADQDNDGVPDENDACPTIAGPAAYLGCPDRDGDGIADNSDQCPDDPEDFDGDRDDDGCPDEALDRDKDGIKDDADKCPDRPEDRDGFEDDDGCPDDDNDGDGLPDAVDACPLLPETPNGYQDQDGCPDVNPALVAVNRELGKIEIKQRVYFDSSKASIKSRSYAVLNEVALVLKGNPSMEILVEGHTDSRGPESFNMRLSDRRARSVREYLTQQGVEPSRLKALGFGETRPIDNNASAEGRGRNRRVEFTITKE